MNYKLNSNYINEFGPSYWNIIHLEAFKLLIKKINLRYEKTQNSLHTNISERTSVKTKSLNPLDNEWDETFINKEEELKNEIDQYFKMLSYLIDNMMCSCRNHATRLILINKFDFYKDDIFKWTIDLHNSVNIRLNKKILSYNDVINKYKKYLVI